MKRRVAIMGAAGRDFHNFNVFFRNNKDYEVVLFTATQIPFIEDRRYPPELSGPLYPDGIPIYPEEDFQSLFKEYSIDVAVLAYSDLSFDYVMQKASRVLATGADFMLMGPKSTMLVSSKPVISVCAVRTGCGKSQTTRYIANYLAEKGIRAAIVRHPMPYGDLRKQIAQRFASFEDLDKYNCTIEEREEYEPHIRQGHVVFAGVDYEKILRMAEKEADVILWDGGNNDLPFYKPDLHIVVVDPLRPGDEVSYYPGTTNLMLADVVVVNKIDSATSENVDIVLDNVHNVNSKAKIVLARSKLTLENSDIIKGKRVLVVEDGPTVTHGGMPYGAGYVAAKRYGAKEIVSPRPYAQGTLKDVFAKYSKLHDVLPAMGYSSDQIKDLERTIDAADCDLVISGTPIDLNRLVHVNKPIVHVTYALDMERAQVLNDVLDTIIAGIHHGS